MTRDRTAGYSPAFSQIISSAPLAWPLMAERWRPNQTSKAAFQRPAAVGRRYQLADAERTRLTRAGSPEPGVHTFQLHPNSANG
jgi:hypothetical protein